MKHKTIAVCLTGYDREYEVRILEGINKRAEELGMNVLLFLSSIVKPSLNIERKIPDSIVTGEMQVFRLINYDAIDGIIVFGGTLLDENVLFDIVANAKYHKIPIINVDDFDHPENVCRRVILSNEPAMEKVVDHLIEVHGAKTIDMISGFLNNPQSQEREEAYRRSLEKHGIGFEPDRVFYGEFWRKSVECTEQIIERGIPDAIVCANDTMAFFCMDTLKEHGYEIPRDVIVTGFDAISDGQDYDPTPTTVRRALKEAGITAVDTIYSEITSGLSGETADILVESNLVLGGSCGCNPDGKTVQKAYDLKYQKILDYKEFNRYTLDMYTEFSGIERSEDLFEPLHFGAGVLDISRIYVCISAELENSDGGFDVDSDHSPLGKVPEKMVSMYRFGHEVPVGEEFYTDMLIPGGIDDGDEPVFYVIAPLYFKNTFLGYMAFVPDSVDIDGDILSTWLITICNNTGSFYMNRELEKAIGELQSLYLHDSLTGLFNRRGLNRFENEFIYESIRAGKYTVAVCADVDGLKKINDGYGHEEGDNAIVTSTRAITECFPKGSISVRTGGDEFFIIAAFESEVKIQAAIESVNKYLDAYNYVSGKPYNVGCSMGYYPIKSVSADDIETARKKADKRMYEEKHRRKAVRTE